MTLRLFLVIAAVVIAFLFACQNSKACEYDNNGRVNCFRVQSLTPRHSVSRHAWKKVGAYSDPRPHAWCGWWLRQQLGIADRAFNLARQWAHFGQNAGGPAVGVIVVWRHHVGVITGRTSSGWIVKSGNDGHAVRERERSLAGVIAYRWQG
jgi:hypothetical protein